MSPSMRRYLRLHHGFRVSFALFVVTALVQVLAVAPLPFIVRHIFDSTLTNGKVTTLILLGGLLVGLQITSSALGVVASTVLLRISAVGVQRLRAVLFDKLYALPISFHDRRSTGDIHDRVVHETERVDLMTRNGVATAVPGFIFAVGILVVLSFVNWVLLLVTLAFLPVVWWINHTTRDMLRTAMKRRHASVGAFSSATFGALRAMRQTRILGAEAWARSGQDAVLDSAAAESRRVGVIGQIHSELNRVVSAVWMVLVLVVGGASVINARITLGELFSFYAGLALIRTPVAQVTGSIPLFAAGRVALDRIFELLDTDEPIPYTGTRKLDVTGSVVFDSVSFGYSDASPILESVSMRIGPGEIVALMGANGSGKTSVSNLLLGFHRPNSGHVTIDGVDYADLDMQHLRRQFGVLTQHPILVPGSVRDNIAYGRPGLTDREMLDVLALVSKVSLVEELEAGLDTRAFENEPLLSGGQMQRVALARALLGRPRLLILDEPSNHLDAEGVETFINTIRHFPDAPATLLITHERIVAELADRVYQLVDGHMVG